MLRSLMVALAIAFVGSGAQALTVVDRTAYWTATEIFFDFPSTQSLKFRYDFDPSISSPTNRFEIDYGYTNHHPEVEYNEFGEIIFHQDHTVDYFKICFIREGETCKLDALTATFTPGRLEVVLPGLPATTYPGPCAGLFVSFCRDNLYVEAIWDTFPWNDPEYVNDGIPYRLTYGAIDDPDWDRIPTAVPEPATWALMIVGFGVTGLAVRRRHFHRATCSGTADWSLNPRLGR